MAIPVLIIGKSGAGKSMSLRNCINNSKWGLIRVLNKPLPFKGKIGGIISDNYRVILGTLSKCKAKSIVIDDAGYLITNTFMRSHSTAGAGNKVFNLYNNLADEFWQMLQYIISLPADKIVYVIMHEDIDDYGNIKAKTIGKLLDEKVCIEGMFTIVLRAVHQQGTYKFVTQSEGGAISKSPIGLFDTEEIDNDLKAVDDKIRQYYEIAEVNTNEQAE